MPSDQDDQETSPSFGRIVNASWACFKPTTRSRLVVSSVLAAGLAGLDAVAVGLLPTMIRHLEHRSGGLLAGLSTPALGASIGGLMIAKSLGGAVLLYWQSSFLAHGESERTIRLFDRIFQKPYAETSLTSSSTFVRDLHVSIPMLYRGAGAGLGQLIADGLGLIGLIVVVIISSPFTGLVLFVYLVLAAWLYARLVRSRVSRLSVRMHDQQRDCLTDLNESFGGLKTLKAFTAENVALDRFSRTRSRFAFTVRDLLFYQQVSRYFLEIILVLGLGTCLVLTYALSGTSAVLLAFGLLTGVAARAMPALGRVLYSLTNIKVSGTSVLSLEPDLRVLEEPRVVAGNSRVEEPSPPATPPSSPPAAQRAAGRANGDARQRAGASLVSLDGVRFSYPTADRAALRGVTMDLAPGELVAVLGESGAGKTTLVDVLIGLLEPERGSVRRLTLGAVGYVAQETFVWDTSVRFNVTLDRAPAGRDIDSDIWSSLDAAQLGDWVRSLPDGLESRLGERGGRMSGGQRQRLGLARALYGRPSILVLDEPTSALDGVTSRSLLSTLVKIKTDVGIIVVTHDPIVMEYADRTVTLVEGKGSAASEAPPRGRLTARAKRPAASRRRPG